MTKNKKISGHFQAKFRFSIHRINKQDSGFFHFWLLWLKNEKRKMEWTEQTFKVQNNQRSRCTYAADKAPSFFIELQAWRSQELKSHHPSNLWYKSRLATENIHRDKNKIDHRGAVNDFLILLLNFISKSSMFYSLEKLKPKIKLKTKNQNIFCWCKWKFDNFFIHSN